MSGGDAHMDCCQCDLAGSGRGSDLMQREQTLLLPQLTVTWRAVEGSCDKYVFEERRRGQQRTASVRLKRGAPFDAARPVKQNG